METDNRRTPPSRSAGRAARRWALPVAALLVAVLLPAGFAAAQSGARAGAERLPHVVILATGGTIAGQAPSATTSAYQAARLGVETLIEAVPELKTIARVSGEQVCQVPSQNMSDAIWLKLAGRLDAVLADPDVDGVVITHGTDTIEETAYFLNLVVASDKPVVVTGAMKPANALGADGPLNLFDAVAVASSPDARNRGVLLVMDEVIHGAREVTKANVVTGQVLESPIRGPAGGIIGRQVFFFREAPRTPARRQAFSLGGVTALPRVDILYAHANMSADLIDAAVKAGARGLVIAGTGTGNMTDPAIEALARAVSRGVVAVRSTRMGSGLILRNQEIDDDKYGFVASDELNPQKARVLLLLALLGTSDRTKIQDYFLTY